MIDGRQLSLRWMRQDKCPVEGPADKLRQDTNAHSSRRGPEPIPMQLAAGLAARIGTSAKGSLTTQ